VERPVPSASIPRQFYLILQKLLNLLTFIRILIILAINTLLLQEATVNTISLLQMHIACPRHFPGLATHIHLPTIMQPLKHLHHASVLQSRANIVARERLVSKTHNWSLYN
jgi:hypothetical protein